MKRWLNDAQGGRPPNVTATEEGSEIIVRIALPARRAQGDADELVPFPFGIEAAAARALVRNGTLKAVKIGRRVYARRSDILALVDRLAPANDTALDRRDPIERAYEEMARNARSAR